MPKVSVIVPVYNVAGFIRRCAESLFAQTLDDVEFIFVDDASPDDSITVLQEVIKENKAAQHRARLIRHSVNRGGFSATRNTGLQQATGDYVFFCDADDFLANDKALSRMYHKAIADQADVLLVDFYMRTAAGPVIFRLPRWNDNDGTESLKQYMAFTWTCVWGIMASREIYLHNNIRFQEDLTYCEDFLLCLQVLYSATKVTNFTAPVYCYDTTNPSSCMHDISASKMRSEQRAYLAAIDFLGANGALEDFLPEMCWRTLKSTQDLLLDKATHQEFIEFFPRNRDYIMSCLFLNRKLKIMAYCLTHHLGVTRGIVDMRRLLNR